MRKLICIILVCFMIVTMFTGCGVLQKLGLQKDKEELQPVSSVVMNEDDARSLSDKMPVQLYFANDDNTKLKLEVRYIPLTEGKKSASNLASIIVKELISGPKDSSLKRTIPEGTALRGPVTISAGVATVDLTKSFIDKHPGGKDAEQMTIFSIVNSLTEMKDIEKVRFTIEGKTVENFRGSYKLNNPFPRTISLIGMETDKPTLGPGSKDSTKKGTTTQPSTGKTGTTAPSTTGKTGTTAPTTTGKTGTTTQPSTGKSGTSGQQNTSKSSGSSGTSTSLNTAADNEKAEATYLEVLN